ncbi:hypothetical protein M8542_31565 [Amycolatopsis sp. OK19-0408]|uniref:Uncharacterized protein n=1 Tax=Amycolatopsis iheyensis TaxID=2945988 RepID=A0A9X2NGK9_9PSEU|nr:hypothetical protein [Amycolatopsis iheyensis]MCR6487378.1 hypothetical protein [Amycolatopsis iheyensis]
MTALSHRDRAILRAVAAGRGTLRCGYVPDLYVDGVACCDQHAVHSLARAGLLCAAREGVPGAVVPAALTELGNVALDASGEAA